MSAKDNHITGFIKKKKDLIAIDIISIHLPLFSSIFLTMFYLKNGPSDVNNLWAFTCVVVIISTSVLFSLYWSWGKLNAYCIK